jgi:aspartyl-tRNA(Asn)/glutamyl-tRNA(Gln) amidotransferase subunit B
MSVEHAAPGAERGAAYEPVIGLEIHVQLNTDSKMFCACPNRFGDEANTLVCPVCSAQPGALPTVNGGAVEKAIQIGLALDCRIAERCQFHRKNYFYPDSPKAYQISQYDEPICADGHLDVGGERVGIVRAHLEEDAAKLVHAGGAAGRIAGADYSLVDFNRCGTPLVEIVTAPDIHSPESALRFLTLLRSTLQTVGVSDCDMEKGSLRCDANVSVRPAGSDGLGIKTELKNMNSFKFLGEGIAAEIARQVELVESGRAVVQETLHYDPQTRRLRALRSKEEAHDYRYFPEPDLVPLEPARELVERLRSGLPELPAARIARFAEQYGLSPQYATDLNSSPALAGYFEAVAKRSGDAKAAADWVLNHPAALGTVPVEGLGGLIRLIAAGTITNAIARQVYELLAAAPESDPAALVEQHGLASIGDAAELERMVDGVIAASPKLVEQYRGGKQGVLNAMVGQIMRETRGRADARSVQEIFRRKLAG